MPFAIFSLYLYIIIYSLPLYNLPYLLSAGSCACALIIIITLYRQVNLLNEGNL